MSTARWGQCPETDPAGHQCRLEVGHAGVHEVATGAEPPRAPKGGPRAPVSSMATPGEQPLAEAKGNGGYIWVFPQKVRIKHSGVRGLVTLGMGKGDKELQIDQISGMQWRDAGMMLLGHIQFTLIGGSTDSRVAAKDENAVQFEKKRQPAFEVVRATVDRLMHESRQARAMPVYTPTAVTSDIPDQLRKLGELRDAGILTQEEFASKKAELLARM